MKRKKWKTYIAGMVVVICLGSNILPSISKNYHAVYATEETEVRNVNLNNDGKIAGITNPTPASASDSEWKGSYIYYGKYRQSIPFYSHLPWVDIPEEVIKWRVLSSNTTEYSKGNESTILLLSDRVLDQVEFNIYENDSSANDYSKSNLRKWLNSETYENNGYTESGFLKAAFTLLEREAIAVSIKAPALKNDYFDSGLSQGNIRDKVFLLGTRDVLNTEYGFYANQDEESLNTLSLKSTDYAKKQGANDSGKPVSWWLRSASKESNGSIAYFMNQSGKISESTVSDSTIGIAPAINIDLSSIMFTSSGKGKNKGDSFKETNLSNTDAWYLTLAGGTDFTAEWGKVEDRTVTIRVTNLGKPKDDVKYTQLSAMLVDDTGTVICYGKLEKNDDLTGDVKIKIPDSLEAKVYTLKIFAEDIDDKEVDYASNMVDFTVKLLDKGVANVTVTPTPTPTPSPTPTPTPSPTPTPTPSPTPTPTPTPTPSLTPSPTPEPASKSESTPEPAQTSEKTSIEDVKPTKMVDKNDAENQENNQEAMSGEISEEAFSIMTPLIFIVVILVIIVILAYLIFSKRK